MYIRDSASHHILSPVSIHLASSYISSHSFDVLFVCNPSSSTLPQAVGQSCTCVEEPEVDQLLDGSCCLAILKTGGGGLYWRHHPYQRRVAEMFLVSYYRNTDAELYALLGDMVFDWDPLIEKRSPKQRFNTGSNRSLSRDWWSMWNR